MALDVLAEVVRTHETLVTHRTGEPLLPGVGAEVAGKFVRACEPLEATVPATRVGTLASVCADVCLQVRALSVGLAARIPGTNVSTSLPVLSAACYAVWADRRVGHFLRAALVALRQHRQRREGRDATRSARAVVTGRRAVEARVGSVGGCVE